MKIVLINTRSRRPDEIQQKCFAPVNLLYLASSLLHNGHKVEVIDANAFGLSDNAVAEQVKQKTCDLIGISLLSETIAETFRLTERLKKTCPWATILLGGPHATAMPETVLEEFSDVDLVLTGECEESIVTLCGALEHKTDIDQVPGLYYRQKEKIMGNKPAGPVQNPDSLPFPARDLLLEAYEKNKYYMIL